MIYLVYQKASILDSITFLIFGCVNRFSMTNLINTHLRLKTPPNTTGMFNFKSVLIVFEKQNLSLEYILYYTVEMFQFKMDS